MASFLCLFGLNDSIMYPNRYIVKHLLHSACLFGYIVVMGRKPIDTDDFDRAMARLLDRERAKRGLSLRDLDKATGIHFVRVGRLLRGERGMTLGEFESLCDALGLSTWETMRVIEQSFE